MITGDPTKKASMMKTMRDSGLSSEGIIENMALMGYDQQEVYQDLLSEYEQERSDADKRNELLTKEREAMSALLKKKDGSSEQGGESSESSGAGAFNQPETVADPNVYRLRDADQTFAQSTVTQSKASELRDKLEDPSLGEDERANVEAEAMRLEYEARDLYAKGIDKRNQLNASLGVDFRYRSDSQADRHMILGESLNRLMEDEKRQADLAQQQLEEKFAGGVQGYFGFGRRYINDEVSTGGLAMDTWSAMGQGLFSNVLGYANMALQSGADALGFDDMAKSRGAAVNYWGKFGQKYQDFADYRKMQYDLRNGVSREVAEMGFTELIGGILSGDVDTDEGLSALGSDAVTTIANGMWYLGEIAVFQGLGAGRAAAAGASALSRAKRGLNLATAIDWIPSYTMDYRMQNPHASNMEAFMVGGARGYAEGQIGKWLAGLGRGLNIRTAEIAGGRRQAVKAAADASKKRGVLKTYAGDLGAESLEEGSMAMIEWITETAADLAAGRDPKSLNFMEVSDAFIAGAIGASGPTTITSAASHIGHTMHMKDRLVAHESLRRVTEQLEKETDPQRRARLEMKQAFLRAKYMQITEEENKLYEQMTEPERQEILKLHQEISHIDEILDRGQYWDGTKVDDSERAGLEARKEELMGMKSEIESEVDTRTGEEEVEQEVEVEDGKGNKVKTKSRKEGQEAPEGPGKAVTEKVDDTKTVEPEQKQQQQEEPSEEQAEPEKEEAAQEETPLEEAEDDSVDLDFTDLSTSPISDTSIPMPVAKALGRLQRGLGGLFKSLGVKVRYHKTKDSFYKYVDSQVVEATKKDGVLEKNGIVYGFVDKDTGTIHLNPDVRVQDVFEEFGHVALEKIIGKDAASRLRLYKEVQELAKTNPLVAKILGSVQNNPVYKRQGQAKVEEEAVVKVLVAYAMRPDAFKKQSAWRRLVKAINSVWKSNTGEKKNLITGKEGLLQLAEKFKNITQGQETEVQEIMDSQETEAPVEETVEPAQETEEDNLEVRPKRPDESQAQYNEYLAKRGEEMAGETELDEQQQFEEGMDSMTAQQENQSYSFETVDGQRINLTDVDIYYTAYPTIGVGQSPMTSSRFTTYSQKRVVRINDSRHFRNWWNKLTGNQRADRVSRPYYYENNIAVPGKEIYLNKPRPFYNKDGTVAYREVPLTYKQRQRQQFFERQDADMAVKKQAAELAGEARRLFSSLKFGGLVHPTAFEPALPEGVRFMDLNGPQALEFVQIKIENLKLAQNLTRQEVEDMIIEDGGRVISETPDGRRVFSVANGQISRPEVIQASGLKHSLMVGDGDALGDVSFSFEVAEDGLSLEGLQPDFVQENIDGIEANYRELADIFMVIMGYDRTDPDKGLTSGQKSLRSKSVGFNKDAKVLSSHVDPATALRTFERLLAEARRIQRSTGRTSGKIGIGFSTLEEANSIKNPEVFEDFITVLAQSVGTVSAANQIMKNMTKISFDKLRRHVMTKMKSDSAEASALKTLMQRHSTKESFGRGGFESVEQFNLLMDFLKKNHYTLKDQFSARESFYSSPLMRAYMKQKGEEVPSGSTADDLRLQIARMFNDPSLSEQRSATLNSVVVFDYKIVKGPDGKYNFDGLFFEDTEEGFGARIVTTRPTEGQKTFRNQYVLEKLNPKMKVYPPGMDFNEKKRSKRAEKRIRALQVQLRNAKTDEKKAEIREKIRQEKKEVKKVRIETLSPEDQAQAAKDSNQFSQFFVRNRKKNKQDYSFEMKEGLTEERETDLGSFQMRQMTGFQRWSTKWLRRLQDKYIDIFNIQASIEDSKGRVDLDKDFKMAEELMYGKAANDLRKLDEKVDAITALMKQKGLNSQQVSEYMYALHAPERNALIKERMEEANEKAQAQKKKTRTVREDGSGMTNQRAQQILDSFSPQQTESLEQIAELIREIQQDTRDTMVNFGLESQETIAAWESLFENYVPLGGLAADEMSPVTSSYPTGGSGLSVFGSTTKRAEGRKSEAENVLAQVVAQNSSVHIKARTNEALQALYNLVEDNPNPNVWEILDEANSLDPHVVSVRVNGEQKFVRFRDPSYAETLRGMSVPASNMFVRLLRIPANWLRRSFTTLNPEFMISNFSRDIQAAVFNAAAEADIEGGIIDSQDVVTDMIKKVPATLKALMHETNPKVLGKIFEENPEIKRYYEEFMADGGKTGWSYAKPLDQIVEELDNATKDKTKAQELLSSPKGLIDFVEGMNDAFENSIRLAAYIAARENGVSRGKAAQLAKNVTVNFNKSGEYGQVLNSVYLFFNASVQGTARLGRSLATFKPARREDGTKREWHERINTAQKLAFGLTVFSGMLTMLSRAISDEDDDGILFYDKIPDYVKERNLVIMRPNGKDYFKIPLPYGFNFFASVGSTMVDVAAGGKDPMQAVHFLSSSLMNSFSPISFGQAKDLYTQVGKSAVPTVLKPMVDIMTNETYFGGPVYSEQLPFGVRRPESTMSFRSPESIRSFFEWMNGATGGSARVPGAVDVNPDKFWYLLEYYIGGAGNFVGRTGKTIRNLGAKIEDPEFKLQANDIPMLRVMYGEQARYYDTDLFRKNEETVKQLALEMKDSKDRGSDRYKGILALNKFLKVYTRQLKVLRDQKRKARDIKDYTERMKRIQVLQEKERQVQMKFNKQYEKFRD